MKNQIKRLETFFSSKKKKHSIGLAYLFGSRAAGTGGPISDYDIGVLFSKVPLSKVTYNLVHQLANLLRTDRMDLVVLNHAPIELRYAVIVTAKAGIQGTSVNRQPAVYILASKRNGTLYYLYYCI